MIPDYILRPDQREFHPNEAQVNSWIDVLVPPPDSIPWKQYFKDLLEYKTEIVGERVFGYRIHRKFFQSIILEMGYGPLFPLQADILGCPVQEWIYWPERHQGAE